MDIREWREQFGKSPRHAKLEHRRDARPRPPEFDWELLEMTGGAKRMDEWRKIAEEAYANRSAEQVAG